MFMMEAINCCNWLITKSPFFHSCY